MERYGVFMRFDREALGGGLTVYTEVKNGKVEIEFTAYIFLGENADNGIVEFIMTNREGSEVAVVSIPVKEICVGTSLIIYPHLWQSIEDPYQYCVTARLFYGEEIIDKLERYVPIYKIDRSVTNSILLNDKPFQIRAVGYEIPSQISGNNTYTNQIYQDMKTILSLGANTICLLHPSTNIDFYNICQKMGILVWQEADGIAPLLIGKDENSLLALDRIQKKDLYYLYKAKWCKEPFVHICGRSNCKRNSDTTVIQVYSNQKKVALYVNGILFEWKESKPEFIFSDVPLNGHVTIISAQAGDCFSSLTIYKSYS